MDNRLAQESFGAARRAETDVMDPGADNRRGGPRARQVRLRTTSETLAQIAQQVGIFRPPIPPQKLRLAPGGIWGQESGAHVRRPTGGRCFSRREIEDPDLAR